MLLRDIVLILGNSGIRVGEELINLKWNNLDIVEQDGMESIRFSLTHTKTGTQRVVIATDDIPIALVNTNLAAIETTCNAIQTAVEVLDNAVSGSEFQVDIVSGTVTTVGGAAEDAAVSGNPVLVGGRYDTTARTLDNGDVGAIALNTYGAVHVSNLMTLLDTAQQVVTVHGGADLDPDTFGANLYSDAISNTRPSPQPKSRKTSD